MAGKVFHDVKPVYVRRRPSSDSSAHAPPPSHNTTAKPKATRKAKAKKSYAKPTAFPTPELAYVDGEDDQPFTVHRATFKKPGVNTHTHTHHSKKYLFQNNKLEIYASPYLLGQCPDLTTSSRCLGFGVVCVCVGCGCWTWQDHKNLTWGCKDYITYEHYLKICEGYSDMEPSVKGWQEYCKDVVNHKHFPAPPLSQIDPNVQTNTTHTHTCTSTHIHIHTHTHTHTHSHAQ